MTEPIHLHESPRAEEAHAEDVEEKGHGLRLAQRDLPNTHAASVEDVPDPRREARRQILESKTRTPRNSTRADTSP